MRKSTEDLTGGPLAGRPQRQHVIAALVALLISLLFHLILFGKLPPIHLGRPVTVEQTVKYPAINIHEVLRTPTRTVEQPDRFRPERPGQSADVYGEPDAGQAAKIDLPLPDAPAVPAGGLAGDSRALVTTPQTSPIKEWEPRQDIIEIENRIYSEAVSTLPRRFTERTTRMDRVPDITLPTDVASAGGSGLTGADRATIATRRVLREGVEGGGAGGGSGTKGSDAVFPGPTTGLTEKPDEISRLKPTEQYLELQTSIFRPPDEKNITYFQIRILRKGAEVLPVLPRDVVLIQDCSESMTADKLADCKRGLRRALDRVHDEDRVEIMSFSDSPHRCFSDWAPFSPTSRGQAMKFIDDMRAQGNTDVYASLNEARRLPRDPARPLIALLLTDGRPTTGITDSSDIIEGFTMNNQGRLSFFSFGAGSRVNRFLLELLSYRNRGDSLIMPDVDRIPEAVDQLAVEVSRPVLADLSYHFAGIDDQEVFPRTLTHLYLDRPLIIYGRVIGKPASIAFQIIGHSGEETRDLVFPLDLEAAKPGEAAIRTSWVWHRIYDLIGQYIQTRRPSIVGEINAMADRHRLSVPFTGNLSKP